MDHCTVGRPAEGLSHSAQMAMSSFMSFSPGAHCTPADAASAVGRRAVGGACSMQNAAAAVVENESRNLHVEARAVLRYAEIAALHGAGGGAQPTAAGVLEGLARLEQRLVADHAQALHLFHLARRIGNDPVARNQLGSKLAGIGARE